MLNACDVGERRASLRAWLERENASADRLRSRRSSTREWYAAAESGASCKALRYAEFAWKQ